MSSQGTLLSTWRRQLSRARRLSSASTVNQGASGILVRANIASCAQRDLYRKYRWPAAKDITAKLEMFKETMEE